MSAEKLKKVVWFTGCTLAIGVLGLAPVLAEKNNNMWVAPGTAHQGLKGGFSEIVCWTGETPVGFPANNNRVVVDKPVGVLSLTRVYVPKEVQAKRGYTEQDICADGVHLEGTADGAALVVFSDGLNGVVVEKVSSSP